MLLVTEIDGGPVRKLFIQTSRNLLRKQYSHGGIAHTRTLNTMNNYFLCSSFSKTLKLTSRTVCRRKRTPLQQLLPGLSLTCRFA